MNTNGQPINMNAVREHYRLQFGVNKSRTLAGLVGK